MRAVALLVCFVAVSAAAQPITPSGGAVGPSGASTQTANSAAGNEPAAAGDGVSLLNQCRAQVIVSAASGQTLSGGGTLKFWFLDTTQASPRWNLLVEGTDPVLTSAASRRDASFGVRKTFPYGRLYVEADTVTASGGALTVRIVTFPCKQVTSAPSGGGSGMFAVLGMVRDAALGQVEIEGGGGITGLTSDGSNLTATVPYLSSSGTCSAPAFAWSADADGTGSGWYRQAANVWSLCLNGTEMARFTTSELRLINTSLWLSTIRDPSGNQQLFFSTISGAEWTNQAAGTVNAFTISNTNTMTSGALLRVRHNSVSVIEVLAGGLVIGTTNASAIAYSGKSSGALDFGSIAQDACADLTQTLTGAVANDPLACGYPAALAAGLAPACFVSAADTVTYRLCNNTAGAIDPASGTFTARVIR